MGIYKLMLPYLSLIRNKHYVTRNFCINIKKKPPWKVLFFGADEFSVFSLRKLAEEYRKGKLINKLEVVTTIKGKPNSVKIFSEKSQIKLHSWPTKIHQEFDVGLVVSFGHLIPKEIIQSFPFGMLNVHASLLPRWRGAAPIIYAIAKGDTKTGITIMKISPHKFDVGEIVLQDEVPIGPDTKMMELYKTLGKVGAKNLVKALETMPFCLDQAKPQPNEGITYAPKVDAELSHIKWDKMTSREIQNLSRALDGVYHLQTSWDEVPVKLINIKSEDLTDDNHEPGYVEFDKSSNNLRILCADSRYISVEKVGVLGKKIMSSSDFTNGYMKKKPPNSRYFK